MKKIISVFLSAAMLSATVASAAYTSKSDILTGIGITDPAEQAAIDTVFNQPVNADIKVKKVADTTFVDGPINVEKTSSEQFPKFDFKAIFEMRDVWQFMYDYVNKGKGWLIHSNANAENDLKAVPVKGQFVIEITYPAALSVPASFTGANNLFGFTSNVSAAFVELGRQETVSGNSKKTTITVKVKDGMNCGELMNFFDPNDPSKSSNFELDCADVQPTAYGTYKVQGKVTGQVKIGDPNPDLDENYIGIVNYDAVQKGTASDETLNATISVTEKSGQQGGTIGSNPGTGVFIPPSGTSGVKVQFDINGNKNIINALTGTTAVSVNYDIIKPPAIEGMTFDGWYVDPGYTTKLTGTQNVSGNLTVYGRYIITTVPDALDEDHKAYIKGYPDGTVQPNGLITREEVTTALYRLLKDSVSQKITTQENNYTDVAPDRWSNTSISSMTNGGYIKGYEDGTFRPSNDITRAEFAALMLRFFKNTDAFNTSSNFSDIAGHWAENNIMTANAMGLFNGYNDGTFRPDSYITRAEAMAVINRITVRRSTKDSFVGDYINWPDISENDWYYVDVIEATNTHDHTRIDEIMTENWTDVSYIDLIVG